MVIEARLIPVQSHQWKHSMIMVLFLLSFFLFLFGLILLQNIETFRLLMQCVEFYPLVDGPDCSIILINKMLKAVMFDHEKPSYLYGDTGNYYRAATFLLYKSSSNGCFFMGKLKVMPSPKHFYGTRFLSEL